MIQAGWARSVRRGAVAVRAGNLATVMMTVSRRNYRRGHQSLAVLSASVPRRRRLPCWMAAAAVGGAAAAGAGAAVVGARRSRGRRVRRKRGLRRRRCSASSERARSYRARCGRRQAPGALPRSSALLAVLALWLLTCRGVVVCVRRLRPRSAATPKFSTGLNGDAMMSSVTPRGDTSGVDPLRGANPTEDSSGSSGGVDLTGFTMFVDRM